MDSATPTDLAGAIMGPAKPLFAPENTNEGAAPDVEVLAPTLQNIKAALNAAKNTATRQVYHPGMDIKFNVQAMSSDGYLALNHVGRYNPTTGYKTSTLKEDDFEREIIYLTYGLDPQIDRETATAILKTPGWGPDNATLIAEIIELNPPAEERVNNLIMIMAFCRFETLLLRIFKEAGAMKELAGHLALNEDVVNSLNYCVDLFSALFKVEETAKQWNIPLDRALLCNAKQIMLERGASEEDTSHLPDPPGMMPNVNVNHNG